jgi:hypothetical protein
LKRKESGDWPPTWKLSVPCRDGRITLPAFDKNCQPIDLNTIIPETKGAQFAVIARCTVWVAGGKFGATWTAKQVLVIPKQSSSGFQFRKLKIAPPSDLEEDEVITSSPPVKAKALAKPSKTANVLPVSDEEDSNEDSDEDEIKPVAAPTVAVADPVPVEETEDSDSSSDLEEDDEEEDLPPPPPKPAAKVVRKAKN